MALRCVLHPYGYNSVTSLRVVRHPSGPLTTRGVLFYDGHFFGFTCEDVVREVPGQRVEEWKVAHETAIPVGTYGLEISPSNRFQRDMPRLLNVPGFAGILIHPGNKAADTDGCILVGDTLAVNGSDIAWSRRCFERFFDRLKDDSLKGPMQMTVEGPRG